MTEEVLGHLRMGREALQDARLLLEKGSPGGAVNRAYYAMFHAASAMLASEGSIFRKHSGVVDGFGEIFAKPRKVDPKFHRFLRNVFVLRQDADYEPAPERMTSIEVARRTVNESADFVAMAERYLAKAGE